MLDESFTIESISNLTKQKRIPFSVSIELLTSCNYDCIHCYLPNHNSKGLEKEKVFDILEQLRKIGTLFVTFTGGEILLRDDIIDIIKKARELGLSVSLLSNASLVTDKIAQALGEMYINNFSTTIFSMDSDINDLITTRKGSLYEILHGIELLKKNNVRVIVKTPVLKYNENDIDDVASFCHEKQLQHLFSPSITSKNNGDISPKKLCAGENAYLKYLRESGSLDEKNIFNMDDCLCEELFNQMFIDSNGNVYPCSSFYYNIGNIYTNTIFDIWNSNNHMELLNIKKERLTECKNCELLEDCFRCPGRAYTEDNSLFGCSSMDKKYASIKQKYKNQQEKLIN